MTKQETLGKWLTEAYRGRDDCPPPEALLAEELAALEPAARQRLEAHVRSCPACAAERRLATAFDEIREEDRADLDWLVDQLDRKPSAAAIEIPETAQVVTIDRGRALRAQAWWPLALAATLLLAVGLVSQLRPSRPGLPELPETSIVRSSRLELLAPQGDITGIPEQLMWSGVDDAATYRVTVERPGGDIVWQQDVAAEQIEIEDVVRRSLQPAVVYSWAVEALDKEGSLLARSAIGTFRIQPES